VLAGTGRVVVVELVDDVGVDVEVEVEVDDLGGTLVVGLMVGAGAGLVVGAGAGLAVGVGVGTTTGDSAGAAAAGGAATASGSGDGGSGVHAGAHCAISNGAARIARRPGCLFICSLTLRRPPAQLGRVRLDDTSNRCGRAGGQPRLTPARREAGLPASPSATVRGIVGPDAAKLRGRDRKSVV